MKEKRFARITEEDGLQLNLYGDRGITIPFGTEFEVVAEYQDISYTMYVLHKSGTVPFAVPSILVDVYYESERPVMPEDTADFTDMTEVDVYEQ